MTVTVTNDHTEFWDATSSPLFDGSVWGSGDGASSIFFVEGTQSMNAQNKGTGRGGMGYNNGTTNITGMHLHTWVNTLDLPSSNATGGWAIRFSSSDTWDSNYASFNAGGLDTSRLIVKRFQPFVVDPSQTPDRSSGPPALTAVTNMWAESDVTTNSGQKTVFVDRMFYGSHSRFRGGTTAGAAGTSAEAALETPAVPVFIKADGVYHILDGIEIGDDTSATSQYWEDGNETWVFADQNVSTTFYRVELRGHATGTHSRIIGTKSGTGIDATGSGGYTFVAGGAAPFHFISTDSNLDVAGMYGCIWNNAGHEDGTFELTTGEHIGHSFSGMGQLTLDCGATGAIFTRCGVADSVTAAAGLEQAAVNLGTTKPATNAFRYVTIGGASRYGLRVEGTSTVGDSWDLDDIVIADSTTADVLVDYPAQTGGNKVNLNLNGTSALSSTTQVAVTGGIALADVVVANSVPVGLSGVTEGTPVTIIADETVGTITKGDVILSDFADSNGEVSASLNYEGAFDPSGLDVISSARNQGVAVAAIADDGAVFTDETAEASSIGTNDMTLLPTTPVVNDAYYLGHTEQFNRLKIDVSTILTQSSAPTLTWEYWNGAWVALSGVVDGTNGFETLGENVVSYTLPGDWATTTVNSQGPLYYVRVRLSVLGTITQAPKGQTATLDVTRYLPYSGNRTIVSVTGLADIAAWTEDTISKFEPTD